MRGGTGRCPPTRDDGCPQGSATAVTTEEDRDGPTRIIRRPRRPKTIRGRPLTRYSLPLSAQERCPPGTQ